ncbi:TBC-domain-containing protein [Clathrospora elynae]|uniref:TBC-domain-containing protein n=1 Tax=Clathrospora elynae TaxID=706981 RepID=A0A6A5T5W6_9PLEO|nr:TBC-domain-containing protein [Clathrospora elynae]
MAAIDTPRVVDLVRTASQNSTRSNPRNRSIQRVRPSKRASNTSLSRSRSRAPSPAEDTKSLTSFPSLSPSPDSSPVQSRINGWFRSSPAPDESARSVENRPVASPDTVKVIPPPELAKSTAPTSTVRKVTKSTQQIVGTLVAASSSKDRSALFDDTPAESAQVPGNLHFASNESIQDALRHTGAVALVKQLAGDLAQRDAQITALRRRAEERERVLRRMLQECEVSNMDIENRLRELEKSKDQTTALTKTRTRGDSAATGLHPDAPMEDRLARAMEDELAEHPDALGIDSGTAAPLAEARSIHSVASEATRDTTKSNWKSYIWSGTSRKSSRAPSVASLVDREADSLVGHTRSRASSGAKPPRKALVNDLFVPPTGAVPALRRLHSQEHTNDPPTRRSSSVSLASWALKMVAGNSAATSAKASTVRGRKSIVSDAVDRAPSMDSTRTAQSAKSSLASTQRRGRALGPNGTIKSISTEPSKNGSSSVGPAAPTRGISNLGPVEMDRILPEESRPPTLVQHHNRFVGSSEYLTDRFGFIYDQRRKKRQSEAAAELAKHKRNSNVESLGDGRTVLNNLVIEEADDTGLAASDPNDGTTRPSSSDSDAQPSQPASKIWADYLKLATHPTELLSHTPSAAPITTVDSPEVEVSAFKIGQNQITLTKRGSLPTSSVNPEPSPSRIFSGNAELSVTTPSPGPSTPINQYPPQVDPVKSLLDQMSELHDNLQKERIVKWNDFLRKVRAQNKREGDVASTENGSKGLAMPEQFLADGELIGIAGLGNKGKVGRAKWQEFRKLVLGGIPVNMRAAIWAEGSGALHLRTPGYYEDLANDGEDDPIIATQIQMDITRTLTDNIFFRTGPGVQKLNEVLLAYSRRNPEVGYCQGMNLITACLLLIMPTPEDAFWVLTAMIEDILPQHYYDQDLLTSRADQMVLRAYVREILPRLSAHLDELEIELEALTFQWFLSIFTDCLSAEALFRVWDVVLCMHDGSTFLFQIALALLKLNEKALLQCDTPAGVYHYINHQMTNHAISIDGLIQASDALGKVIKRKDVEERRARAVAKEQESMRQRDEARQERARKRASKASADSAPPVEQEEDVASISASLDAELSMQTSPMRTPLSSASKRSEEEEDADFLNQSLELTTRTPMPIDEECQWRG